jgi:hypothetical protein
MNAEPKTKKQIKSIRERRDIFRRNRVLKLAFCIVPSSPSEWTLEAMRRGLWRTKIFALFRRYGNPHG